jgi:DNA transformation protein and related proteins
MVSSADFVNHVKELLAPAGQVVTKRMFGGHGVYIDGLFMAIIADDELYLKADGVSCAAFDAEDCAPFVYIKDGKPMTMSYRRTPDEAMDAPHLMLPWARLALEAALRARAQKATAKTKPAAKKKSSRPAAKKRPA